MCRRAVFFHTKNSMHNLLRTAKSHSLNTSYFQRSRSTCPGTSSGHNSVLSNGPEYTGIQRNPLILTEEHRNHLHFPASVSGV
ncbi:hypothetical protein DPEC_G00139720 [Dallia pectoralis]|uniref:Uncharacterized protein n=1 Tax=Dallia pectoralis TaxID=75939 RepID=A0ACC2GLZ9_DALPE|nr:hypothetical protein DPEC_G00139720 [Dallia pectoralis]